MSGLDPRHLYLALFLVVAFVLAGLVHSAWLGSAASSRFLMPIDGGRTFRGRRIFGDNKTVRGFMAMVPAAAGSFALLAASLGEDSIAQLGLWDLSVVQYAALGAWAGFGFMAGELPNSFLKRQAGVAPGDRPRRRAAAAAAFIGDRTDSILGMLLAVSLVAPTSRWTWWWCVMIGVGLHWAFSALLHRLGVKARTA
jgi:hypothetical protein